MLNSVALDVVIGLLFIYLLYSLLATIIGEIVTTYLGLRARHLKMTLKRMLEDGVNKMPKEGSPNNKLIVADNFYDQPLIKYLTSGKRFGSGAAQNVYFFVGQGLKAILGCYRHVFYFYF